MRAITLEEYPEFQDTCSTAMSSLLCEQIKSRVKHAFLHNYHINDEDATILQSMYPHRLITQNPNAKYYKDSSHPILAIQNDFCNDDAQRLLRDWKSKGFTTLSIGDSANMKLGADHNCLLLDSSRDMTRVASTHCDDNLKSFAHGKTRRTYYCVDGCHNCHVRATHGVAVHSIYDITPKQLYQTFVNKGLDVLIAYIYFPLGLFDKDLVDYDITASRIQFAEDKVWFTLRDDSAPYIHNANNWKMWATVTKIATGPNGLENPFDISVEKSRKYGSLYILNMVRTRRCRDTVPYVLPLSKICRDVVRVPDLFAALHNDFAYPQARTPHFVVPRDLVQNSLAYSARVKDQSYQFSEFAAVFTGYATKVIINNRVYRKTWQASQETFKRVTFSLFLIGAIQRTQRTSGVSEAFKELKRLRDAGVFGLWWHDLKSWFHRLSKFEDPKSVEAIRLDQFRIEEFEDVIYDGYVKVTGINEALVGHPYDSIPLDEPIPYSRYESDNSSDSDSDSGLTSISQIKPHVDSRRSSISSASSSLSSVITVVNKKELAGVLARTTGSSSSSSGGWISSSSSSSGGFAENFANPNYGDDSDVELDGEIVSRKTAEQILAATLSPVVTADLLVEQPKNAPDVSSEAMHTDSIEQQLSTPEQLPFTLGKAKDAADNVFASVKPGDCYIGDYSTAYMFGGFNALFINCANTNLTDGGYQAKAFAQLFPNYKQVLGVNKVDITHFGKFDKAHLGLVVALDMRTGKYSFIDFINRLHAILKAISNYAKSNDLVCMLPIIGCGSYGGCVACFKTALNAYDFKRVMCHFREEDRLAYDALGPCKCAKNARTASNKPDVKVLGAPAKLPPGTIGTPIKLTTSLASRKLKTFAAEGHCALRAIWCCIPREERVSVGAFFNEVKDVLMKAKDSNDKRCFPDSDINAYLDDADWSGNNISACIIPILAKHYKVNVTIVTGNIHDVVTSYEDKPHHIIDFSGNHYQYRGLGGTIAKFAPIVKQIAEYIGDGDKVLETSAAPGYLLNHVADYCMDVKLVAPVFYAGIYTGARSAKFTQKCKGFKIQKYDGHVDRLFSQEKFDFIICDAGRDVNTEQLTIDAVNYAKKHLNDGGSCLFKTFGDPHYLYQFAVEFNGIELLQGAPNTDERYFLLICYHEANHNTFHSIYDRFHRAETQHTYKFEVKHLSRFADQYFSEFPGLRPKFDFPRNGDIFGTFSAITGFASSAKTSTAIKNYPNAIFISPTQVLARKHQSDGVISYTQHLAFTKIKDGNVIVLDELSQFNVEYVALLKLVFPSSKIIVLGDIYQTEGFGIDKFTKFEQIGVTNNILDVYSIPQDICRALNDKFAWNLRSKSSIAHSVCRFVGDVRDLAGKSIKVLCVNNATEKELTSFGVDAATVTSYTGSRTQDVAIYVDAAAIASNYINNVSLTYTAVTRATKRLFLIGSTGGLEKFYNFDGTLINSYSEINDVRLHDDIQVKADVVLPVTQSRIIPDDVSSVTSATTIVSDLVKPASTISDVTLSVQPDYIPPVQSGTLVTNEASITRKPSSELVHRITNIINPVINQSSGNSVETIRTLVKRYSRKYNIHSKVECEFAHNQIMKGLTKALYGTSYSRERKLRRAMLATREELMANAFAYLESLDDKLGDQVKTSNELTTIFDHARDGDLSFFNKRQVKHKDKDGFDTEDKVGQGVAAFDKRVNILLGTYARTMLDKIKNILADNNRNIFLATHDSEAQLNDTVTTLLQARKDKSKYTCNDFSEWDASFRKCFIMMTYKLLEYMGLPEELNQWFMGVRNNWKMTYRGQDGPTTLYGREKQFSGNPFTIAENTIGNLALCFALFDYKHMDFALFKGDDSCVSCIDCTMLPEARKILKYTQHGLKLHHSPIGEFAGWFMTDSGMFPDVYRYTVKFLCKNYRDNDHFEEAKTSLQERCSAVKDVHQLTEGCTVVSAYYSERLGRPLSSESTRTLFYFLRNSRGLHFGDTTEICKHLNIV